MTITELKERIMERNLSNFYIFTGTEIGIQNIYLNQMAKVLNLPITRADSVLSIYSKCTSRSLFGNEIGFYVIRDDNDITKQENVYTKIENEIGNNVIVLLYEKIDSRLKFGKYFKDKIVEFEKLNPMILKNYIKKVCPLNEKNLAELSNEVSGCYDLALLECSKVNSYAKATSCSVDSAFRKLIDSGVICRREEANVFDFTDAVMRRQTTLAFKLSENLLNNGTQSINILGTLYNTVKSVLLIQVCENSDISGTTGLDNGQIYFNKKYVGKYNSSDLVYYMKLIAGIVDKIKNGKIDDMFSIQYVLVQML